MTASDLSKAGVTATLYLALPTWGAQAVPTGFAYLIVVSHLRRGVGTLLLTNPHMQSGLSRLSSLLSHVLLLCCTARLLELDERTWVAESVRRGFDGWPGYRPC